MLFTRLVTLLAVSAVAISAAVSRIQMEEKVEAFSSSLWKNEGVALDADIINSIFVIKRDPNLVSKFETQFYDLSNPSSPNYAKWLTKDQLIEQMAPSDNDVKVVTDYLESFGILNTNYRVSDLKDKVFVSMPTTLASRMLDTDFSRFRSVEDSNVVIIRASKPYSLPTHVAAKVSLVDDILRFPSIRKSKFVKGQSTNLRSGSSDPFSSCGSSCAGMTTPAVLEQAYSFSLVSKAAAGNSVAVAEFQNQYYDNPDLQAFSKACGVTTEVDVTIGGNNPNICKFGCVEALLDIEYIGAITHPIPLTSMYYSSYSLLDWADDLISMKNPPLVNSVSYGNDEIQQTSTEYMYECNTQFMMAGTLGLSLLVAAGDQGVWGRTGVSATYNPDFPASSPYITAVGGTNFQVKSVIGAESAWNCTGGGFSNTFAQPSYQVDQVANYLKIAASAGVLPASSLFNATGRAYPDVSALAGLVNPYCVAVHSGADFEGVGGTSAACPVVAGIFAQLNNVRLSAGKTSLGFLNPLIYANPQCFQDVNDLSQNNCNAGTTGFASMTGWDPATGNGTPNFACLAKLM